MPYEYMSPWADVGSSFGGMSGNLGSLMYQLAALQANQMYRQQALGLQQQELGLRQQQLRMEGPRIQAETARAQAATDVSRRQLQESQDLASVLQTAQQAQQTLGMLNNPSMRMSALPTSNAVNLLRQAGAVPNTAFEMTRGDMSDALKSVIEGAATRQALQTGPGAAALLRPQRGQMGMEFVPPAPGRTGYIVDRVTGKVEPYGEAMPYHVTPENMVSFFNALSRLGASPFAAPEVTDAVNPLLVPFMQYLMPQGIQPQAIPQPAGTNAPPRVGLTNNPVRVLSITPAPAQ